MTVTRTADLTFLDVRKRFDFRSLSIGRPVTSTLAARERERSAGKFYAAPQDLVHALRCPEQLISLRGSLSFQFGPYAGQLQSYLKSAGGLLTLNLSPRRETDWAE